METEPENPQTGTAAATALLTEPQAAERLGLSTSQLGRLRAKRRISFYKRAGRVLYAPEEVERVLRAFEVPAIHPVVKLVKAPASSQASINTSADAL